MINLVQQYFTQSAKRHPAKNAINCANRSKTFKAVDERSNAIANHFRSGLANRGDLVPFFMRKDVNCIDAILSILKSDCAYVPVDINSPANRVQAILSACSASFVIVDNESKASFEALVPEEIRPSIFVIDDFSGGDIAQPDYKNLSIDIAYVLFTSGSTGVPKGVMIPHKAIIDYIDWCVDEYQLDSNDVIANHAPLYFDNSTFDLYTAFKTGAELHLVDDAVNAIIPSLVKWIRERRITTFFCVPSVLSMLLRSRRLKDDSFPELRHLICAGEVLPPDVLRIWMEKYPHIQFTNMYGPTEITVDCSFHVFTHAPEEGALAVPIGKARPNMELFVRDDHGNLSQNAGARGELLVRGTSVAYGYLGDDEKTRKSFVQNPQNSVFNDMLYCTGDLVEIAEDGNYVFVGRADDQIKYLGYRIELGEIEAALATVDGIDEGVVVFNHAAETSEQAIGALISSNVGLKQIDIVSQLNGQLPPYMVPTVIKLTTDDFPQTANGKYDRKAIKSLLFEQPET